MNRWNIINFYIKKYKYERYLEIGVSNGENIEKIRAKYIDGVDPGVGRYLNISNKVNHKMTSDDFFENIKNKQITYDFVFIDGLHESDQVDKDIDNSLRHLSQNGIIMLHDTLPTLFEHQVVPRQTKFWNGDVWKSVVKLRYTKSNLQISTINHDCGCTLIKRGLQELYDKVPLDKALTWEYFNINREKLMNIVNTEDLNEIF